MKRIAALLAVGLLLAGCEEHSKEAKVKTYRFAIIPKMLNNEVFNHGKIAAEKTARDIEAKEGVRIEILWDAPPVSNPAQQAAVVQSYASQRVQGISLSVDEANTLRKAIDEAAGKNIPVMTFDSDCPASKRRVFFGTDDIECGERLAMHLGNLIRKGKVAIQSGTSSAPNLQLRVKGAKDAFAKNFPEIEVVDVLFCNDDLKKAIDDIASFTSAHPDLAGWLFVGGWALFGKDALKPIDPAKTKVVSCDALPPMWTYLESGKCQMLLAQDLWGWGEQSVRLLKDMADGKEVKTGPGGVIRGALEEVTAANLEAYKKQWIKRFGPPK